MARALLLAVATLAVLLAAGPGVRPESASATAAAITWQSCGGNFQCATLKVPVDYSKPAGATLDLALLKLPARDQSKRIGSLVANPGGPGASAVDFVRAWSSLLSRDIRDRFDIVTFDPRGVAASSPIVCHDNLQALVGLDPSPDTASEWDTAKRISKAFAEDCNARHAATLPFVGTKNVARDMESLRVGLGEETLTFVGYSYGTVIGAVYADMYPKRVRAFVLDGAVDLSLGFEETVATQAVGFERALAAYVAECDAKKCAASPDGNTAKTIDDLLAKVEEEPLPAPSADRPAGPGETLLGLIEPLYSRLSWNSLTRALADARKGDGSGLVKLADQYLQRQPDGSYPNLIEANSAVNYIDEECPKDSAAYLSMADRLVKRAPHFGASAVISGLTCAYWPAKPDPLTAPRAAGAPPILVIGTTNDPATPYEWSVAMSRQLQSGVLLTHRGEGHTIYAQGDSCVDRAVNAYLLELTVPAAGTSCGNGAPPPGGAPTESPQRAGTPDPAETPQAAGPSRPRAPGPPGTGESRDNGSATIVAVALASVFAAIAAATAVVMFQRR
ncbi:MAG: proteinase [Anaerolinea sp.]|nr:proteinase [Anaerolinea sp.]